jgi:hypothetical protein
MQPSLLACTHDTLNDIGGGMFRCAKCREWFGEPTPELTNPICHANDPATSRAAANDITKSGRRATDATKVHDAVRSLPGSTSTELASAIDMHLYAVRRRLTDLKAAGLVRRGDAVRRNGANAESTWWTNS